MLKIRRPLGRLIFNMGIAIPGKTVFLIETAPRCPIVFRVPFKFQCHKGRKSTIWLRLSVPWWQLQFEFTDSHEMIDIASRIMEVVHYCFVFFEVISQNSRSHRLNNGFGWILWLWFACWRHQMETFSALLAICAGNSPHKGQWRGALMYSLIRAQIYGWAINGEAGDLRRHRAHYDVIVMKKITRTVAAIKSLRFVLFKRRNNLSFGDHAKMWRIDLHASPRLNSKINHFRMIVPLLWTNYLHDDVIKWKRFPRYWPFVRGIHRSPVNSPHKGQWRGALMFYLICARINTWVNNR